MNWMQALAILLVSLGVTGIVCEVLAFIRSRSAKTRAEEIEQILIRAEIISKYICKHFDKTDSDILLTHLVLTTQAQGNADAVKVARTVLGVSLKGDQD